MPQPLVTVIVLNWNAADRTIACIETLRRSNYDNFRIHLVDNGSTDGSADRLSSLSGVNFTRNRVNLGYTGGNNTAMRDPITARSDYFWLLNNDTAVPPDCLSRLVSIAEGTPEVGLVSPVIRDNDSVEASQICCGIPDPNYPQWRLITNIEDLLGAQTNTNGRAILYGTALLIKRSTVDKIGYFDDRLFAYCEDYDYSMRSMRAGLKNIVATDAYILHDVHDDKDRKAYYFYYISRNYLLVSRKHFNLMRFYRYVWWRYRSGLTIVQQGQSRMAIDAYLAGWWDGVRGHGGPFDPSRSMPALIRWALFPQANTGDKNRNA
jgi:GT2 family glycosyltransferase